MKDTLLTKTFAIILGNIIAVLIGISVAIEYNISAGMAIGFMLMLLVDIRNELCE